MEWLAAIAQGRKDLVKRELMKLQLKRAKGGGGENDESVEAVIGPDTLKAEQGKNSSADVNSNVSIIHTRNEAICTERNYSFNIDPTYH